VPGRITADVPAERGEPLGQMRRQNREGLNQRDRQGAGHHHGQDPHEITHPPLDEQQGHERGDGGQYGNNHRPGDLLSALDRGELRLLAPLDAGVDVLTHHNGVIDDQAQNHDQPEHADQVERRPDDAHQHHRPAHGDNQPHHDPKGDPPVQKQQQRHEHQG